MRTVQFYRLSSGHCPIEEFLDSLNGKQAQKVIWVLRLIEEMEIVPVQYFKKLTNSKDLWEVRIRCGNDQYRLLCFIDAGTVVVLTNGFIKKTQKIPPQEIALAIQRKQDYYTRRKDE